MNLRDQDESVDGFLNRIRELEIKSKQEDFSRSQGLQDELSSMRSSVIAIPRPVARQGNSPSSFQQSFSSAHYTDDLAYQSAYNYEKTFRESHPISSIDKVNYSPEPKLRSSMPEVIRFDDFVTPKNVKPKVSKYSQFQITEERKQEIDNTIKSLIDNGEDQSFKALTREHKGGYLRQDWTPGSATKSKLDVAANIKPLSERTRTHDIKKSPKKNDLSQSIQSTPKVEYSPIKRSPAKINISDLEPNTELSLKSKPVIKPKPQTIAYKTQIEHPSNKSWIDSVRNKETKPIPQETTNRISFHSENHSTSFLDSVKRNTHSTSHSLFDTTESKIKITNSQDSSLKANLTRYEESERQRTSTLKELKDTKLLQVKHSPKLEPPTTANDNFKPILLKKVRPSIPEKPKSISLDFNGSNKNQDIIKGSSIQRKVTEPEALKKSKNLKPPLPQRKPSLEVPEAFKKSKSLKPPVPKQKPQLDVPEVLEVLNKLQPTKTRVVSQEPLPEAMKKLKSLKPGKPIRKPTPSELEALSQLKNIKKKSNDTPPKVLPKSNRVTSQSKEILNSQLSRLRPVKEERIPVESKTELMKTLEKQFLRKAHTETDLLKSNIKPSNEVKRANTFDGVDVKEKKLNHITNYRTKGPKRRVPNSVK